MLHELLQVLSGLLVRLARPSPAMSETHGETHWGALGKTARLKP